MARAVLVKRLAERHEELVDATVERIAAEIPAYGDPRRRGLLDDVREHVSKHHEVLVGLLAANAAPTREDLLFTRRHTAARVGRIPIADYMHAFRIYQDVMWRALLEEAADGRRGPDALALVGLVLDYVNLATTFAAELYIEIEQLELAGGERIRRDLLDDLVAGRPVPAGAPQEVARAHGLGPTAPCLVLVAVPRALPGDELALRSASGTIARACASRLAPLTVLRHDEIAVVAAAPDSDLSRTIAGLTEGYERLAKQQVRLAIGVSTVQPGLTGVAEGYREARGAAECLGPAGGVLALPALSAFDYLISFHNATAERLIAPRVRAFVREDLGSGGVLAATLRAYVDCDLNVKALSRRLYIHANTAHNRLNKIAELTGLDLRKLENVLEVLVAVRLADPVGAQPPGAWGA